MTNILDRTIERYTPSITRFLGRATNRGGETRRFLVNSTAELQSIEARDQSNRSTGFSKEASRIGRFAFFLANFTKAMERQSSLVNDLIRIWRLEVSVTNPVTWSIDQWIRLWLPRRINKTSKESETEEEFCDDRLTQNEQNCIRIHLRYITFAEQREDKLFSRRVARHDYLQV